MKTQIY